MNNSKTIKMAVATVLVFLAAATRLLPHEANFTPLLGIAIFGAAIFADKKVYMFLIPLLAMFVSDLFLGLNSIMIFTYSSIALIIGISYFMLKSKTIMRVIGSSLIAAGVFFVLTNFGAWLMFDMYDHSIAGLLLCYEMAIPFFRSTLISTVVATGALFGVQYAVERLAIKTVEQA